MLSGPSPVSAPTISTSSSTASTYAISRPSRLRGLSYLRNYTGALLDQRLSTPESSDPLEPFQPRHSRQHRRRPVIKPVGSDGLRLSDRQDILFSNPLDLVQQTGSGTSAASQASVGGWLPTVDGSACLARPTTQLQPNLGIPGRPESSSTPPLLHQTENDMVRRFVSTPAAQLSSTLPPHAASLNTTRTVASPQSNASRSRQHGSRSAAGGPSTANSAQSTLPNSQLPSIRFVPYNDPRSSRPSLAFPITTRTLPSASSTIRVGRYSEKDSTPQEHTPTSVSDAPVGFKSKVVSRRHCELFYMHNQWHIKDVKSSSGTFLNHIRLSPPGEESKPFAIKDGDLVQLGIDFKGGEEMIFRCVKIRIQCNRGWQKSLNKFNKSAHKQLNDLHRGTNKAFKESTECTICLNSIAPCQSLFVAPCSHTWHYKCIRPMLEESSRAPSPFAQFLCPNCRALADLDADIEEGPSWQDDFSEDDGENIQSQAGLTLESGEEDAAIPQPDDFLSENLSSLVIHDGFQHPAFGLPPASSTSRSRSGSIRALNPGASSFVPISSSVLPPSATPSLPIGVSESGSAVLPSLRSESVVSRPASAPDNVPLDQTVYEPFSSEVEAYASALSSRHVAPYEDDTISSPDSEYGTMDDLGYRRLDATVVPVSSPRFANSNQEEAQMIASSIRQQSNGDVVDRDGPMTPRNNAGPFVFDGAADRAAAANRSATPFDNNVEDTGQPLSLNQAAVA